MSAVPVYSKLGQQTLKRRSRSMTAHTTIYTSVSLMHLPASSLRGLVNPGHAAADHATNPTLPVHR